jgi:hypothetical protein
MDWLREVIVRWEDPAPEHAALLSSGGITAVLTARPDDVFRAACQKASLQLVSQSELEFRSWKGIGAPSDSQKTIALNLPNWPGVSRGPSARRDPDNFVAAASAQPWIDASGYCARCLRAIAPDRPPLLVCPAGRDATVPFDSFELALIQARVAGGNSIAPLEPRFRKALLASDPKATAAWKNLRSTVTWLQTNAELLGRPILPTVTALVAPGADAAELANLLTRQGASPRIADAAHPPPSDPEHCLALIAASVPAPQAQARDGILAHAERGATLVVDERGAAPWWKTSGMTLKRDDDDREFYSLGRGQVVAYKRKIVDPSEFAFDVIDLVTHKRRAVRLWNAPATVVVASTGPQAGPFRDAMLVPLVNYGEPRDEDFPVQMQGLYRQATLLRPGKATLELKPVKRGTMTEVQVPELARLAMIVLR